MRIRHALAIIGLALIGLGAPSWAAAPDDGSAECVSCHDEDDLSDMSRSAHAERPAGADASATAPRRSYAASADARTPTCITCHGASPTHVKKPAGVSQRPAPDVVFSKKSTQTADARSGVCLQCHQHEARRMQWDGSAHQNADLACNACHKVHANRDKVLAKATQTDVCFACHKEQRVQMNRASHHPVPEGKMSCADCHNAHGSAGPKLARRDSTNDTCYTCHAEKRGPFVHAHEPVTDDCATCHNPHGSTVAGMLKVRAPILCQQCHTPHVAGAVGAVGGQPGVFTPSVPGGVPAITATTGGKNVVTLWQGRSCMNCHTQVHGSNNPSATNPTPGFQFR